MSQKITEDHLQNPDLMSAIPDRFTFERKRLGLTLRQTAQAGLLDPPNWVRRIECGAIFPDALFLARLSRNIPAFDVLFVITGRREVRT